METETVKTVPELLKEISEYKKAYEKACKRVDEVNEQMAEVLEALSFVEKFFTERPSVIWPDIKGGESKMADLVMSAIKKATS